MNLDLSLIRIAAEILSHLRRRRLIAYEELMSILHRRVGTEVDIMFLPAVSFLFVLGRLAYHSKTDSFEYVEEETKK